MPKRPIPPDSPAQDGILPPPIAISPLDLILATMRTRYHAGDTEGAIALAKVAAPYLHARMPAGAALTDLANVHDADLDSLRPQD